MPANLINVRDLSAIIRGDEFSYIDQKDNPYKYATRSKEALELLSDSFVYMEDSRYGITQGFRTFNGLPAFASKYVGREKILTDLYATTAHILLKSPEHAYHYYVNNTMYTMSPEEILVNKKRLSSSLKRYKCIQEMKNVMDTKEILEHVHMIPYMIPKQNTEYLNGFVNRYSGISKRQAIDFLPKGIDQLTPESVRSLTKNKNTQQYIINSLLLEKMDDNQKMFPIPPLPVQGDLYYFDIEFIPGTFEMASIAVVTDTVLLATMDLDEFVRFMDGRENAVLVHWSNVDARLLKKYLPDRLYTTFDLLHFLKSEHVAVRNCYTRQLKHVHYALFGDKYGESDCMSGGDVCLLAREGTLYDNRVSVMKYNINDCLMMKDIVELMSKTD